MVEKFYFNTYEQAEQRLEPFALSNQEQWPVRQRRRHDPRPYVFCFFDMESCAGSYRFWATTGQVKSEDQRFELYSNIDKMAKGIMTHLNRLNRMNRTHDILPIVYTVIEVIEWEVEDQIGMIKPGGSLLWDAPSPVEDPVYWDTQNPRPLFKEERQTIVEIIENTLGNQ